MKATEVHLTMTQFPAPWATLFGLTPSLALSLVILSSTLWSFWCPSPFWANFIGYGAILGAEC